MDNIMELNSISVFHELLGYEKPKHPLITLIDFQNINLKQEYLNTKYVTAYYTIALKNGKGWGLKYGRHYYDFNEGSMTFMSPGQVAVIEQFSSEAEGWMLCFHPDLIRGSSLGKKIDEYTFFSYDTNEALHLSESEKEIITNIVQMIKKEFSQNIDIYSQDLIVSNIEMLLNYSKRFYGRQFITRNNVNKDVITCFDILLRRCFKEANLLENGIPTVKYLAKEMGYSANYLSDLLKKETGKNTQEHIQFQHRLEMQAKLGSNVLNSLYEFWNRRLADELFSESDCIINLASKEYSKCISKYLSEKIRFITCVFGEMIGNKVVEKGTLAKMARGEMVRFMAEKQIEDVEDIKSFRRLNYAFADHLSDENTYIFLKKEK